MNAFFQNSWAELTGAFEVTVTIDWKQEMTDPDWDTIQL